MDDKITLNWLRAFHAVASTGSFTRAAEDLGKTQPAVSNQVRKLEDSLGAELLTRKRTGAELTDFGKVVDESAKLIFSEVEKMAQAISDLDGLRAGRLSVGASSTPGDYILPLAISEFRKRHPGVDVALDISGGQEVIDRALSGDIDLGMVSAGVGESAAGLESFVYARDEIALAAHPRHPLSASRTLSLADMDGAAFVMRERGSETREAAERALRAGGLDFSVALELESNEAVKRAAGEGVGIAALSRMSFTPETALGYLKILNADGWKCERAIIALYLDEGSSTARNAFINLLKTARPMPPMPL